MICIDIKYGLIKFTNFYQINYNFLYFSTKNVLCYRDNIEQGSSVVDDIAHIDARCSNIILRKD